jgi:hypothetical protein
MHMTPLLLFLFVPFFVYGQQTHSEDLELVADSSQKHIVDDSTPKAVFSIAKKQGNLVPFLGTSFGNIWLKYSDFPPWWNYSLRMEGFGISGGFLYQPNSVLRVEVGLRFHKTGNRIDLHEEFYWTNYDSISFEIIDSEFVIRDGFFKMNQYYLSLPINANIFLKGLPVYVLGGIEFGYLLYASSNEDYTDYNDHSKVVQHRTNTYKNEKINFRPFDFNLNVGSGMRFYLNKHLDLDIQLVYSHGLFIINNPDNWAVNFMSREVSLRAILACC